MTESAIRAHDCPWCSCGVRVWATLDEATRDKLRRDCADLREVEASLAQHRLYLEGAQTKSINQANQMKRSLTVGEARAEGLRRRMRVILGQDDPNDADRNAMDAGWEHRSW